MNQAYTSEGMPVVTGETRDRFLDYVEKLEDHGDLTRAFLQRIQRENEGLDALVFGTIAGYEALEQRREHGLGVGLGMAFVYELTRQQAGTATTRKRSGKVQQRYTPDGLPFFSEAAVDAFGEIIDRRMQGQEEREIKVFEQKLKRENSAFIIVWEAIDRHYAALPGNDDFRAGIVEGMFLMYEAMSRQYNTYRLEEELRNP